MRELIPPWKQEDHNESDPNLRINVCPIGTTQMPQDHPLPVFFNRVRISKSKKAITDALINYAFDNGCISNCPPDVIEQLRKYEYLPSQTG